ncbi:hypothetical protein [Maioricimonas sp. JC845]|uniref:hypothetical protein n=1 Tax=Maioricimonas sp. JC845 TaxID=3232138 RepID=UPI00345A4BCF
MSIRFAGSRSVDERRRRRLAQEADVATTSPRRRSTSRTTAAAPARVDNPAETLPPELPVVSIIPRSWWKHGLLALVSLAALAAVVTWGLHLDQSGSGLAPALGLKAGRMARFFSTVTLLAAGQLSLLVLWYRAKSRKDFDGRYRIWFWAAVVWLVFCGAIATDAHRPAALLALEKWPLDVFRAPLLVWMVPASAIALAMTRLLRREMRACRASRYVLNLATVCGGVAALTMLAGDLLLTDTAHLLLLRTSTMAWHLGVALATLFHARYVIHVTNEPLRQKRRPGRRLIQPVVDALRHVRLPRLRLPRIGRLQLRRGRTGTATKKKTTGKTFRLPRLRLPKLSLPTISLPKRRQTEQPANETEVTGTESSTRETKDSAASKPKSRPKRKAPAAPQAEAPAPQEEEPKVTRKPARKKAKPSKPATASAKTQAEPEVQQTAPPVAPQRKAPERKPPPPAEPPQRKAPATRIDPPETYDDGPHADFENDRSLSKKERRRLRKLKRQAERQKSRSGDEE